MVSGRNHRLPRVAWLSVFSLALAAVLGLSACRSPSAGRFAQSPPPAEAEPDAEPTLADAPRVEHVPDFNYEPFRYPADFAPPDPQHPDLSEVQDQPRGASRDESTSPPQQNRSAEPPTARDATPATDRVSYAAARELAIIQNPRLRESSGLAVSRRNPGLLWTHNDSGDGPWLYAFDQRGRHVAACKLATLFSLDWEDMASYQLDGEAWLLVADTGDNARLRPGYTLHLIPEPDLNRPGVAHLDLPRGLMLPFRFPDNRWDCEAAAVCPVTRSILLITKVKRDESARVYRLPLIQTPVRETQTATRIAELPLPGITALDIAPNGRRAFVLTYGDGYEYIRMPNETWAQAFQRPGRRIALPKRPRGGEAACYGSDGQTLFLTQEGEQSPLWILPPR